METTPYQIEKPANIYTKSDNTSRLQEEVNKLLTSGAIEKCNTTKEQFVSSVFLRPKSDGSQRFIINLKNFNYFVKKEHFKIEDLRTAINLLNKSDYMCRLDLKDAYLLVPMHEQSKKWLRFEFNEQLYQFNSLPFGLSSAPFIFTKIIKPIINFLRNNGIRLVVYLDDFLIIGSSVEECKRHTHYTTSLLHFLGFIINWKKSDVEPKQNCKFLGMIIDSHNMVIELPREKCLKIKEMIENLLRDKKIKIQKLMECIGILVAACPAISYGWLYYKELERLKQRGLITHGYNINNEIKLTTEVIKELTWWHSQILTSNNKIRTSSFDLEIFSNASTTGWGATLGHTKAHGLWTESERKMHINFLEIKAAFLALKCLANNCYNRQILIRIDNITALSYINKMGGTRHSLLHNLTKTIWEWCIQRGNWIFAEYVASKDNAADEPSRITNLDTEWELANYAFEETCEKFGKPSIDLFASRTNHKCQKYCSWERDPDAFAINALTIPWKNEFWYAFPPFSLLPRILKKIKDENSTGILIISLWTVQPWFPEFQNLLVSDMITWKPSKKLLFSPCRSVEHPLSTSLSLAAGIVSGRHSRKRDWRKTL